MSEKHYTENTNTHVVGLGLESSDRIRIKQYKVYIHHIRDRFQYCNTRNLQHPDVTLYQIQYVLSDSSLGVRDIFFPAISLGLKGLGLSYMVHRCLRAPKN